MTVHYFDLCNVFSCYFNLIHYFTGKGRRGDVVVFFSHSGNTRECVFAASHLRQRGVHILSIIGHDESQLAKCSDAYICYKLDHELEEPIGGVPTTSVILQVRNNTSLTISERGLCRRVFSQQS